MLWHPCFPANSPGKLFPDTMNAQREQLQAFTASYHIDNMLDPLECSPALIIGQFQVLLWSLESRCWCDWA